MTETDAAKALAPDELPGVDNFLVVGIGASAGGIHALGQFFAAVPADSGMAYVVILHLSPDHESNLSSILQNVARILVVQVVDRVRIEPNSTSVRSNPRRVAGTSPACRPTALSTTASQAWC